MLVNLLTDLAPSLAIAVREPSGQTSERLLAEGPHRSLGTALTQEMLLRGVITALGAGLAWAAARLTGRGRRASTVSLAAVVGTQLAQTLTTGGTDRNVLMAGLGSAAVLVAIIQTPGVSQFFGCTPLGLVAWGLTLGAITTATLLGHFLTPLITSHLTRAPRGDPHGKRPTAQMGQHGPGNGAVEVDQFGLGDPVVGEQFLVRAGNRDGPAPDANVVLRTHRFPFGLMCRQPHLAGAVRRSASFCSWFLSKAIAGLAR